MNKPLILIVTVILIIGISAFSLFQFKGATLEEPITAAKAENNPLALVETSETSKPLSIQADPDGLGTDSPTGIAPIIAVDTKNAAATAEFINRYARNPKEKERMEFENQFVHRRELIRPAVTFGDIGRQMANGEDISTMTLPGLNGEVYELDITYRDNLTQTSGTFFGKVKGYPDSDAIITYYKDSNSAILKIPSLKKVLDYDPYTDKQLIVKDFDEHLQGKAAPCTNCN